VTRPKEERSWSGPRGRRRREWRARPTRQRKEAGRGMEKRQVDWARREGEEESEFSPFFILFFSFILKPFSKHFKSI